MPPPAAPPSRDSASSSSVSSMRSSSLPRPTSNLSPCPSGLGKQQAAVVGLSKKHGSGHELKLQHSLSGSLRDVKSMKLALKIRAAKGDAEHWKDENSSSFAGEEDKLRELNREGKQVLAASSSWHLSSSHTSLSNGAKSSTHSAVTNGQKSQNAGKITANDVFASHCWRQQETQELKRRLISELSRVPEVRCRFFLPICRRL